MAVEVYDLIILGAGPAGMAAAIYSGRYGMKTLIIGKEVGGAVNFSWEIENYPGFGGSGADLMGKFEEQAKSFGAVFEIGNIDKLEKVEDGFKVLVGDEEFVGRSVIGCLGLERRKLGIPGEDKFFGKGVSYCTTCDGNFFRGKTVVVIGGSDSAAKAAIYLSDICEKVYISYRKEKMRCEPITLEKIEGIKNIEIIYNSKPVEIIGEGKVSGLRLEEDMLEIDGVFIEVGSLPVTNVLDGIGVELDKGYIKVDKEGRTSVAGLFAAGDGTNNPFKQVITATADGVLAAKSAYGFVKLEKEL